MGRALSLEYAKYGVLGGYLVGPGIVPLQAHPGTIPRVHLPLPHIAGPGMLQRCTRVSGQRNMVVGLKSVDQLCLEDHFSDLRTMTEVYNLVEIGDR